MHKNEGNQSKDREKAFRPRPPFITALKKAGYTYVTLDLAGHRSGAMNEVL